MIKSTCIVPAVLTQDDGTQGRLWHSSPAAALFPAHLHFGGHGKEPAWGTSAL